MIINPTAAFLVYPDPVNNDDAEPEFHGWLGISGKEVTTGTDLDLRNPIGIISVPFRPELDLEEIDNRETEQLVAKFHSVFVEAINQKVHS